MYTCVSKPQTDEERESQIKLEYNKRINKEIEKSINKENKKKLSCLKLLLLGTGESGKSTILKQMKIIHIDGFSQTEKMEFVPIIKRNIRDGIIAIVVAMKGLGIHPTNFDIDNEIRFLQHSFQLDYNYPPAFFDTVSRLWDDEDVQRCWSRSNEYQVIDSAQYFLDKMEEIRQEDYIPSLQDILRCRKMTNAITEINFEVKDRKRHKVNFKVLDVGGQQGERKRWIQLFGDVTAILFLADCSSFDQTLREDRTKNRLLDSLEVFNQAWANRYLQNVPILIFINKIDLLDRKIKAGHSICSSSLFEYSYQLSIPLQIQQDECSEIEKSSQFEDSKINILIGNGNNNNNNNNNNNRSSSASGPITTPHNNIKTDTDDKCDQNNQNIHSSQLLKQIQSDHQKYKTSNTVPSSLVGSRRPSKDDNFEFVTNVVQSYPWSDFEATNEERKEFIAAFPLDALDIQSTRRRFSNSKVRNKSRSSIPNIVSHCKDQATLTDSCNSSIHNSSSHTSAPISPSLALSQQPVPTKKHKSKADLTAAAAIIHPDTIKTACYIKNLFSQIIRSHPKAFESKTGRRRKHLFYYTCAVNTDNIQKVLDGCRSFLMQEHLERFGIL